MKFPGVESLETAPKFRKGKTKSSSCAYVLYKTSRQEISRPNRAVTAKKFTKKCNARTELFFWLLSILFFCFFFFYFLVAVAVVVSNQQAVH